METTLLNNPTSVHPNSDWYSEEFISNSLVGYLKENGYKIHKDLYNKMPDKVDTIIIASKFFSKEIIEVKGYPAEFYKTSNKEIPKNNSTGYHAKKWFSEALLNSFVNFGKYYSNDSAVVAMALPNVDRYLTIIEKVEEYFSMNNLYFKIYLVNQDGQVEVSNLNKKFTKDAA
ncbi:MAG: hypothetical protein LH478_12580 [Chitinophagaceae bacterium]|nr:hypothetical protein [Chitinophagaceae bacterium]